MTSTPYYRIRGRMLDKAHYLEWQRQGKRDYNPARVEAGLRRQKRRYLPKPNLTFVFVNILKEKPKTGTLLDYMETT
jgi:hypothetical protein